jgi:hypothetical protein
MIRSHLHDIYFVLIHLCTFKFTTSNSIDDGSDGNTSRADSSDERDTEDKKGVASGVKEGVEVKGLKTNSETDSEGDKVDGEKPNSLSEISGSYLVGNGFSKNMLSFDIKKTEVTNEAVWLELRDSYDACVRALQAFRSGHISIVGDYIIAQQTKGVNKDKLEGSAGGKGTGGTDLMQFLKPIRDNCRESLLKSPVMSPPPVPDATPPRPYEKDNGCSEDIDLYRTADKASSKGRLYRHQSNDWVRR